MLGVGVWDTWRDVIGGKGSELGAKASIESIGLLSWADRLGLNSYFFDRGFT